MRKLLFIIAFTIVALLPAGAQSVGHGADIDAQINGTATTRQNKKPAAEPHKTDAASGSINTGYLYTEPTDEDGSPKD